MLFLADYTTFTNMEIKINCNTFQWYGRMPSVFEEHRRIVEIKTAEFQEALKVNKKYFIQESNRFAGLKL